MTEEQFIEELGHLLRAPKGVDVLRSFILDLAIHGRLVAQDPSDEPASVLVDQINREREQLIAEKAIRRRKPLPGVDTGGEHAVPNGSIAFRLGEACAIQPKVKNASDDVEAQFLPMNLIPTAWSGVANAERRPWREIARDYTHFGSGDVLIAKITPCFQNRKSMVVANDEPGFGAGTTELHVLRPLGDVVPEWVLIVVKSRSFIEGGIARMTGTAGQQRVPRTYVEEYPVALPPAAEQCRIVKKVNELMGLCDEAEELLLQERALAAELAESAASSLIAQIA